ncbi:MAG: NUDIX domain-containing protein, partial [Candidatus Heimdallarchaeota archaeon]|nr:NUDIX domain-containing protein [Candidatus Heimdallarchaeota archaeon]
DNYVAIGGKIEAGESPRSSIIREIHEETGLVLNNIRYRGIIYYGQLNGEKIHPVLDWYIYVYDAITDEKVLEKNEEGDLHWINLNEILNEKINLWPTEKYVVKLIIDDKPILELEGWYDMNMNLCKVIQRDLDLYKI